LAVQPPADPGCAAGGFDLPHLVADCLTQQRLKLGRDLRGGVDIHTASGDINLDGRPTADWSAAAASGDVRVRFPSNASFTLDASTSSGSISTNHAVVADADRSRRRLAGPSGGGGPRVRLATASGSIEID